MKKGINIIDHLILIAIGIIITFFIYDFEFNLFTVGLTKTRFLIAMGITVIIGIYMIWLLYSKIVSFILKKDFYKVLKKDIITYIPFFLLLFFPLKYISRNLDSRFLQYSHIASAVFLIFAFGLFMVLKVLFLELKPKKEKSLRVIAIISILIFFIIFSTLSVLRHKSFFSAGADLGVYDQTIYGYAHGKMLDSLMGFHLLGDHLEWVLFLIVPIYMIFESPITLLLIQSALISSGAFVFYVLSRKVLKNEIAALVMCIAYLIHPAIQYIILFDFHPTVLPLPFIFLAVYALMQKRYVLLSISLFFTAICKEYFSLILIPFGIFLFFIDLERNKKFTKFKKISIPSLFSTQRKVGLGLILIGIAWFLINFKVLVPFFFGKTYFFIEVNTYFGSTFSEIIKTFLFNPIYVIKYVFTINKLAFLILFAVSVFFCIFAFIAPEYLFLGITELAVLILWQANTLSEIMYHHQIPLLAIVLAATVIGIGRLPKLIKSTKKSKGIMIACSFGVLSTALLSNIFFGPFAILYDLDNFNINSPYVKAGNKILSMIPEDASVIAPNWVVPHLTRRENVYRLIKFLRPDYFEIPEADYIIADLSDALIDPKRSARAYKPNDSSILFNKKDYGIIAVEDTWVLLKKGESYEKNICKIKPFLNTAKYPYLNITIEKKELIEKC